jgi:hypothetical protein
MNSTLVVAGAAISLLFLNYAHAESPSKPNKSATIPLEEIWALRMPGTKPIARLEPEVFGKKSQQLSGQEGMRRIRQSPIYQIQNFLKKAPDDGTEPCFAVQGIGLDALHAAHDVFVKNQRPQASFAKGSKVSVIFFSHLHYEYVHIRRVDREGNNISIRYQFVPHSERDVTVHFAIIPLVDLEVGEARVEISRLPQGVDDSVPAESGLVCQACSFTIRE